MEKRILVIGQTPPPFGGQALMLQSLLNLRFVNVKLIHLNMKFSKDFNHMGSFKLYKFWILAKTIILTWVYKFYYKADILYYGPSGPNKLAVFRDMLILFPTRWLFKKTIFHSHAGGITQVYNGLSPIAKWFFRASFFEPDGLIRLTNFSHGDEHILKPKKCFIVPNGIRDHFKDSVIEGVDRLSVNVLYVGAMYPERGITELITACHLLNRENVNFRMNLMGMFFQSSYKNEIMNLIDKYKLNSKISFLGSKNGLDKWKIYNDSDILCFPSYVPSESFGLVVVEAMQFKIPVVASNWNGIANIVDNNHSGLLCDPQSAVSLKNSLKILIENKEQRIKMGLRGREIFLERYGLQRFKINMQVVFDDI